MRQISRRPPDPNRRSERSRRAVLDAALALCGERGYGGLTIEEIAARAGVGKPTIYRWWPSKGAVILDALNEVAGAATDFPDTGDVVADLRQQMNEVARLFSSAVIGPVYRGVVAAAQSDPNLARRLADEIVGPRVVACLDRLERAQDRQQIRADADLDVMIETLYGPLYHRFLLHTRPIDAEQIDTVLDQVFAGVGAGGSQGAGASSARRSGPGRSTRGG